MALAGCHKPGAETEAESSRGLKVEAYDAPIAKAPLSGKLETMRAPSGGGRRLQRPGAEQRARRRFGRRACGRGGRPPAHPAHRRPRPSRAPVAAPHRDLYDAQPARPATAPTAPEPAGFRLTVPLCRRAESQNDPLAKTPECAQLIAAAKDQAEACRQAFETGDDKAALSPACRQAASFR